MQLLIVEDDPTIAGQIARGLGAMGHEVALAATGEAAIRAYSAQHFDAMVLDRLLPDINGIAVIERLRAAGQALPVLMMSALGSVEDRVEGLFAGADDYLAKPFNMIELAARLVAITRRQTARGEGEGLALGQLRLDPAGHRAVFRKEAIDLNRRQYSLLAELIRHADRLVTRSMLLEAVWNYAFEPGTNIVESNISRLRTRLLQLGCDPIETRRGAGYVLRSDLCG